MTSQDEVYAVLASAPAPMTSAEIAEALGDTVGSVGSTICRMRKWGTVEIAGTRERAYLWRVPR